MQQQVPENLVPRDEVSEEALVGSMLIDQRAIFDVSDIVVPDDFYVQKNRAIYQAMLRLSEKHKPIDILTLIDQVEADGTLKLVGGMIGLTVLMNVVPSAVNAPAYAEKVRQMSVRRQMLEAATAMGSAAYHLDRDVEDVLAEAERRIYNIRTAKRSGALHPIGDVVQEVLEEFESVAEGRAERALSTGYIDLDNVLDGWRRQELTIVAARPGIGKTALLSNLALKSAKGGHSVVIFSAEMSAKTLVRRMVQAAGVKNFPGKVRKEQIDWDGIIGELTRIGDLPLWVDDTPNPSVLDIRAKALRLSAKQRVDLVAVDYVQLLRAGIKTPSRYLEVGAITKTLKNLSREMDAHVLAAAQLSRAAEDTRPTLSMLKESGAQEEDADNVIFIHRAREVPKGVGGIKAEIIIAKQRNGPTGTVTLGWFPSRVCFLPLQKGA